VAGRRLLPSYYLLHCCRPSEAVSSQAGIDRSSFSLVFSFCSPGARLDSLFPKYDVTMK